MMDLSQFSMTIPGWLTLVLAALSLLLSIQLTAWYIESTEPYPYFSVNLPYITEKDENREETDR